jgi:hypothetical protein
MPDGDEIDDFEEASVDDDSQCPRMRTKFSCWKVIFKEILRYICYVKGLISNSWKNHLRYVKSIYSRRIILRCM